MRTTLQTVVRPAEPADEGTRASRLAANRLDAYDKTQACLRGMGLSSGYEDHARLQRLRDAEWEAASREVRHWRSRCQALQAKLTNVLASDALTEDQRALVLSSRRATNRDAKLLAEDEAAVVAGYRALPAADRAAVRRILALAGGGAA